MFTRILFRKVSKLLDQTTNAMIVKNISRGTAVALTIFLTPLLYACLATTAAGNVRGRLALHA